MAKLFKNIKENTIYSYYSFPLVDIVEYTRILNKALTLSNQVRLLQWYHYSSTVCDIGSQGFAIYMHRSLSIGLFGFGEKMGMEVVHDNLREQRRSSEVARAVESQERRTLGVSDHYPTIGYRKRPQASLPIILPFRYLCTISVPSLMMNALCIGHCWSRSRILQSLTSCWTVRPRKYTTCWSKPSKSVWWAITTAIWSRHW